MGTPARRRQSHAGKSTGKSAHRTRAVSKQKNASLLLQGRVYEIF